MSVRLPLSREVRPDDRRRERHPARGHDIYGDVRIGDFFQSGHYAVIRAKVEIGNYCTVLNHSALEGLIRFGDGVRIMSRVYVPSRTWFGNHVFVGPEYFSG